MGVGAELVNEIYAGLWENWFSLLDHVVSAVKGWATVGVPENEADWMKSFSDQWRDHFSILMLIIPNGIVKEYKIYGKRLRKAVLARTCCSWNIIYKTNINRTL